MHSLYTGTLGFPNGNFLHKPGFTKHTSEPELHKMGLNRVKARKWENRKCLNYCFLKLALQQVSSPPLQLPSTHNSAYIVPIYLIDDSSMGTCEEESQDSAKRGLETQLFEVSTGPEIQIFCDEVLQSDDAVLIDEDIVEIDPKFEQFLMKVTSDMNAFKVFDEMPMSISGQGIQSLVDEQDDSKAFELINGLTSHEGMAIDYMRVQCFDPGGDLYNSGEELQEPIVSDIDITFDKMAASVTFSLGEVELNSVEFLEIPAAHQVLVKMPRYGLLEKKPFAINHNADSLSVTDVIIDENGLWAGNLVFDPGIPDMSLSRLLSPVVVLFPKGEQTMIMNGCRTCYTYVVSAGFYYPCFVKLAGDLISVSKLGNSVEIFDPGGVCGLLLMGRALSSSLYYVTSNAEIANQRLQWDLGGSSVTVFHERQTCRTSGRGALVYQLYADPLFSMISSLKIEPVPNVQQLLVQFTDVFHEFKRSSFMLW